MTDSELRKQLKKKEGWTGARVRLIHDVENQGGVIFPKGLLLKVRKNYAGLHLEYVGACNGCRLNHRHVIKGVSEYSVEIVEIANRTEGNGNA